MSALLAVTAYSTGMVPLTFSSSKNTLDQFSLLGAGLLVGTALGVILPEGIETLIRTGKDGDHGLASTIALPLLFGFSLMFLMDQFIAPHAHSAGAQKLSAHLPRSAQAGATVDFDAELTELERQESGGAGLRVENSHRTSPGATVGISSDVASARKQALSLTFGLTVHSLADGMALGVSSLADSASTSLSTVVFLALVIHKAPAALALASSLLAAGVPRGDCKKYIFIFALGTPAGALASFFLFSFLGSDKTNWPAIALLASGGTFLYVATVLQSPSYQAASAESTRLGGILYVIAGILLPFMLGMLLGHHH
ncbi:hypothetical protein APHAL10511_002269 [Amanita phalloides]|nr:hypothetical protein APHAL10511_002269 [Amanita phalloides]